MKSFLWTSFTIFLCLMSPAMSASELVPEEVYACSYKRFITLNKHQDWAPQVKQKPPFIMRWREGRIQEVSDRNYFVPELGVGYMQCEESTIYPGYFSCPGRGESLIFDKNKLTGVISNAEAVLFPDTYYGNQAGIAVFQCTRSK